MSGFNTIGIIPLNKNSSSARDLEVIGNKNNEKIAALINLSYQEITVC